jgi:ABC-type phosphate transport system substrate-binding protein
MPLKIAGVFVATTTRARAERESIARSPRRHRDGTASCDAASIDLSSIRHGRAGAPLRCALMVPPANDGTLTAPTAREEFEMRLKSRIQMAVALAAPLCLFAGERVAHAGPDCATLTTPVYVTGSSAVKPFMKALGTALGAAAPAVTIVYKGQGSCTGVDAVLNGTKITGTASYWDNTGTEQTCNLTVTGDVATIGVSDVFATTCPMVPSLPADVGDFFGPNQVMEMVVPFASNQVSISAEAAYFVWGFGQAGMVTPWTDETLMFGRNELSGTQQMIAHAITVPANKWKGIQGANSGAVLAGITSSPTPDATIGILSADIVDANRDKVKPLAYQHFKQKCASWADSSATSFDKLSVRNGTYPIWGPLHLLAKIDANKKPTNALAAQVIGYFTGATVPPASVNLLDLEIKAHTVPECAMAVKRSAELGDMTPYTPAEPCNCYFDKLTNGTTSCDVCTKDADCVGSAKHCRHGYCEAN